VGIVKKLRDESGHLLKVSRKAFAGTVKKIEQRIRQLGIGTRINTSHLERLNGTLAILHFKEFGLAQSNVTQPF